MNFTESFEQFSSRVNGMDLALYAGIGLIVWVLFKDKLSPVQKIILAVSDKVKSLLAKKTTVTNTSPVPVIVPVVASLSEARAVDSEDLFFKLVVSWKQTRDLAVQSNCTDAIKVADQMFPFLSPMVCGQKDTVRGVTTNE